MGADDRFEEALRALLDGTPVSSSPDDPPLLANLLVLHDIAGAHRRFLECDAAESPEAGAGMRWGHLELREPLGRGASATVYRAWDRKLGREVALKLFDTDATAGDEALREGRLLARLRHPHLVTVFGADTFDGTSGMWMELVRGETVAAMVERSGPWAVEAALIAGRDLASALAAIHDSDVFHRDVKARNVVRERGGRVVLMDMGAGRERSASEDGAAKGTPLYMAPELFTGGAASERSDVYSLGVLLYHVLSGSYPVEGASVAALADAHRRGCRRPLARVCRDLPTPVTALVDRLCASDPGLRPASAREAESLLTECLARLVTSLHEVPTSFERVWARTARLLGAAAAATLLVAVLVAATWDAGLTRNLRWAVGAGAPSGRLFVTMQGRIDTISGGRLRLWRTNPLSATPVAVSSRDRTILSVGGSPPFEQGAQRLSIDGSRAEALGTRMSVCCFRDGTTDGNFNYAIRRDDTRTPGSRTLAPAALYRFSMQWTDPQPLFQLDARPIYHGVTYVPVDDTFVVTRQSADETGGRLERWSRTGRRLAVIAEIAGVVTGVAFDPTDETIWVGRDASQAGGQARFVVYGLNGRLLGTFELPHEGSFAAPGMEFALPDPDPWFPRTGRLVRRWLGW